VTTFYAITGLVDELIDPTLPKADVPGSPLSSTTGLNAWLAGALAAESDDPDLTLRGPVTRWFGYAFGEPRMTKADAIALLPLQPGDPNPLFQICDAIAREGGDVSVGSGPFEIASIGKVQRAEWLEAAYGQVLVMTGGDAEDLVVYFEIDDLTDEVPATFPNRTYTELSDPEDPESGVEVIHTWATWGQNSGGSEWLYERNGKHYRSSNNRLHSGNPGKPINASAWVMASLTGLVVLDAVPEEQE
jgi:hypothetical protein